MDSARPATAWTSGSADLELGAHLVEWLDRRHPVPEADQRAGELPGAGAEIDDVARVQSDEPLNGLVRIAGAAALVAPATSANAV